MHVTPSGPIESNSATVNIGKFNSSIVRIRIGVEKTIEFLVGLALFAQVIVMFVSIISRWLFAHQMVWNTEIGTLCLSLLTFIGGALAYSKGEHMAIDVITKRLPYAVQTFLLNVVDWLIVWVGLEIGWKSFEQLIGSYSNLSPVLQISESYFMIAFPVGMACLTVIAILRLLERPKKSMLLAAVLACLGIVVLNFFIGQMGPWGISSGVLLGTLATFILFLIIGVPIAFVLIIAAVFFVSTSGEDKVIAIAAHMYDGITGYVLLAIPIFIYAGYILTEGGLGRRLAEAVIAVVGRMTGGLLQVIVVSIYIVSGISGSKVADVAAVGSTMEGMLRSNKYNMDESSAVLAAAAIMGETVPPSTPMLVLGSITTLSVGSLFAAGFLPAVVMAVVLMVMVYFRAKRMNLPKGPRLSLGQSAKAVMSGIPSLLVPVLLIGGIFAGIATPTEISSVAVIYALVLAVVFYREMNFPTFYRALTATAAKAGMVLFIISAASSFAYSMAIVQIPNLIGDFLTNIGANQWVFLTLSVVLLIFTGAVLEGMPALILFGPLLLPVATQFGISPLHYGIVLIMAMGMGTFLPPVGIGTYVTCSVMHTGMGALSRKLWPYLVVLFVALLFVAFIPSVTLTLPSLFHMDLGN